MKSVPIAASGHLWISCFPTPFLALANQFCAVLYNRADVIPHITDRYLRLGGLSRFVTAKNILVVLLISFRVCLCEVHVCLHTCVSERTGLPNMNRTYLAFSISKALPLSGEYHGNFRGLLAGPAPRRPSRLGEKGVCRNSSLGLTIILNEPFDGLLEHSLKSLSCLVCVVDRFWGMTLHPRLVFSIVGELVLLGNLLVVL